MGMPQNLQITALDSGLPASYDHPIPVAKQCGGVLLMGDWEIDRFNPADLA
jgi:hypothetical protein